MRALKWIRVAIGLLLFILIGLSFTYLGRSLPDWLLKTQFVPALMDIFVGGALAFIILVVLTLLFGRVYCSFLCPMGVLQDIVIRISNIFKSKKKRRFVYSKPYSVLRYSIMGIVLVALIIGFTTPMTWLDPYSNFGRISSQLFGSSVQLVNNGLAEVFPNTIFYRPFTNLVWWSFGFSVIIFLVVVLFSAFRGRMYCNTICPVGTILGLVSRGSIFRIAIDREKCNGCTLCAQNCKSECIDTKTKAVDNSRCVVCFDCVGVCKKDALSYRPVQKSSAEDMINDDGNVQKNINKGRRDALATLGLVGAAVAARGFSKKSTIVPDDKKNIYGIVPPGGKSIMHLKEHCTACHACIAACPNGIIKPATGEYRDFGLGGFMLPVITYKEHFCAFDCNECMKVCPNGALMELPLEVKKTTQIGKVRFYQERCIISLDGTDCGACDEHCPTKAIKMVPWRDGLLIPEIDRNICIGCGGCEYICPARPLAMIVEPNIVHQQAEKPKIEKQEKKLVDDFGF